MTACGRERSTDEASSSSHKKRRMKSGDKGLSFLRRETLRGGTREDLEHLIYRQRTRDDRDREGYRQHASGVS